MIVEMTTGATPEEIDGVVQRAKSLGLNIQLNFGTDRMVVTILGSNTGQLSTDIFAVFPGVASVTRVMKPYKLASREFKAEDSLVFIDGIEIGGKRVLSDHYSDYIPIDSDSSYLAGNLCGGQRQ